MNKQSNIKVNPADWSDKDLLAVYKTMMTIRLTELRLTQLFADGEVPGFIHLSVGQEAIASALGFLFKAEDTIASTHRGHGHALAKGISLDDFFYELMAKDEGICKGRGGSMHVANFSIGMLGANAIVGASVPIAMGSALSHQVLGKQSLAAAFFGDGAMAEGALHESMNMASLWKLPMLFVCENNGWAEFSPTSKQFVANLKDLSKAFGIKWLGIDGNDAMEVLAAGKQAIEHIRSGKGPFVLECTTHRWRGHYEGDPQKYRDVAEQESLVEHDPIPRFKEVLLANGVSQDEMQKITDEIGCDIDRAVEQARNGTEPSWESALTGVYTNIEEVS